MAKITIDQILEAAETDDNIGFCVKCGAEVYGVESDAEKYECPECGERKVYGIEFLLERYS